MQWISGVQTVLVSSDKVRTVYRQTLIGFGDSLMLIEADASYPNPERIRADNKAQREIVFESIVGNV